MRPLLPPVLSGPTVAEFYRLRRALDLAETGLSPRDAGDADRLDVFRPLEAALSAFGMVVAEHRRSLTRRHRAMTANPTPAPSAACRDA